jgi:protein disulfide-isomerase
MKKLILTVAAAFAAGVFAMPAGFTDDFDAALKKAAAENKTVLALFTGSDWCIWCKRLEGEVLSQKAFSDEVGKTFVPVFLDFPRDKSLVKEAIAKRNKELSEKYAVRGFPTVLLLDAKGEVLAQTGYQKGGPEKYLAHVKGLVQNGPLLKKHIKPYEVRLEAIGRKFGESAEAVAAKVTGDREAKQKAVKAAFPKLAGPILADMQALRKALAAEQVPKAIVHDKDELLQQIDKAVEFLTKASKGEVP